MSEPSPTERLRESIELRKLSDPRIDAMVADVRLIRTEIRGLNQSGNLALGNSRDAVMHVEEMFDRISKLEVAVSALTERLDKASEWFKTKGMK